MKDKRKELYLKEEQDFKRCPVSFPRSFLVYFARAEVF